MANGGVRIIRPDELDDATAQTSHAPARGRDHEANRCDQTVAGTVTIEPPQRRSASPRDLESVIYVVSGLARMRWGDRWNSSRRPRGISSTSLPTSRIRRSTRRRCSASRVLARSGQQGLVVNLDITPVEVPESCAG